jgi:hypothetical protein
MCVLCHERPAPEPLGLCPACAFHVRLEFSRGFRRLMEYLAAWGSFAEWLETHERGAASGAQAGSSNR